MNNFQRALKFTLRWEGGRSDDPVDKGGRTNMGVTQRVYDTWRDLSGLVQKDVWELTLPEAMAIYDLKYWSACKCSQLPDLIDMVTFDAAVNHGPRKAIQFLQRASGVVDDGILGPQTMRAVDQDKSAGRMQYLLVSYLKARELFYHAIVENDPKQDRFLKGWMNRLNDLRKEVGVAL